MLRIKSFLLTTFMLSALLGPSSAEQMSLSGTLKDINDGSSYAVTISPVAAPAPAPVTEPTPVPEPTPAPVPEPTQALSTIPLTWDSSLFANVTTSGPVTVPSGGTLSNKSIAVHNEPASVVMNGGSSTAPTTLKKVRIGGLSREGVRIGGGSYLIEDSYLEATGSGTDHADTIQAYDGPSGARLNLTIRNTLIKAHNKSATAGLFLSDNCNGPVTLENVIFEGGPYGLRLHADTGGDIDLSMTNVYFVGPFGYNPFYLLNYGGKKVVIKKWENVRAATIVNGKLVPGNLIPRP